MLRSLDTYALEIAKICGLWTFWPVIQVINHLFKFRQKDADFLLFLKHRCLVTLTCCNVKIHSILYILHVKVFVVGYPRSGYWLTWWICLVMFAGFCRRPCPYRHATILIWAYLGIFQYPVWIWMGGCIHGNFLFGFPVRNKICTPRCSNSDFGVDGSSEIRTLFGF